jgi:hypothetical protein
MQPRTCGVACGCVEGLDGSSRWHELLRGSNPFFFAWRPCVAYLALIQAPADYLGVDLFTLAFSLRLGTDCLGAALRQLRV